MKVFSLMVVGLLFLTAGCKKDDEAKPAYVGVWVSDETTTNGTWRTNLTITETTLEVLGSIVIGDIAAPVMGFRGNSTVSENLMTINLTEIGSLNTSTNQMEWINSSSADWDAKLIEYELTETMLINFTVEGNTLTVTDSSGDQVFTRQ